MPFSDESLGFLFENRVVNSKTWFLEHRDKYENLVLTPLRELVVELTPTMLSIDPLIISEPKIGKSISRIYRDTRFSRDKSIFRDVMWCSFGRGKRNGVSRPEFFFELSPSGFRCGCGWYQAPGDTMDVIRDMVRADDKHFLEARRALDESPVFGLMDTRYKRTRHPDQPEEKRLWLDQRGIGAIMSSEDFDLLYSEKLAEALREYFTSLAPFYNFLLEADTRAAGEFC